MYGSKWNWSNWLKDNTHIISYNCSDSLKGVVLDNSIIFIPVHRAEYIYTEQCNLWPHSNLQSRVHLYCTLLYEFIPCLWVEMASSVTPPRVTRAGTVSTSIQKETQEITTSKTVIEHLLNMLKTSL